MNEQGVSCIFNYMPHNNEKSSVVFLNIKQEDQEDLSMTELRKLWVHTTEGLETKFGLLLLSLDDAQLESS